MRNPLVSDGVPSALLRDPRKRPEAFEDLKKLQSKIWEVCPGTYAGITPLGRSAGRPQP